MIDTETGLTVGSKKFGEHLMVSYGHIVLQ